MKIMELEPANFQLLRIFAPNFIISITII